jgi:hypothetical protein
MGGAGWRCSRRSARAAARSAACSGSAAASSWCPLLILWLGYEERTGDGTSLAAIALDRRPAAAIRPPTATCTLAEGASSASPRWAGGARHVAAAARPVRWISLLFAVVLVGVAIDMRSDERVATIGVGVLAGVMAGCSAWAARALRARLVLFSARPHRGGGDLAAAIVPVALMGSWRHHRLGQVEVRDALTLGVLAIAGAVGGGRRQRRPGAALELGFAVLLVFVAAARPPRTSSEADEAASR